MRDDRLGTANPGPIRPPLVYFLAIVAGVALNLARPYRLVPPAIGTPLGAALTGAAIGLFLTAVQTFRAAGTPVPGDEPTTAIVRTGPYRFSRNPIYVAFSLLHLGVALWVNSPWLILTMIPAVMLMALIVIPREEAYLEAHFAGDYLSYKGTVRRWL